MKIKRDVPVWLSVILLVLCAASVLHSVYAVINNCSNIPFTLMCLSSIILGLSSIAYCIGGYKKSKAVLFKIVCLFLALTAVMGLIQTILEKSGAALIAVYILLALVGLVFLAVPNLGKKVSYILAALNLALTITLIAVLMITGAVIEPVGSIFSIVKMVIFGVMVYAKYVDKDSRGTK